MEKKIFLLVLFLTISFSKAGEVCKLYSCGTLSEGECAKKTETEQLQISYTMSKCLSTFNSFCPFNTIKIDETAKCQTFPALGGVSYPGAPCENKEDCVAGANCSDDKKCFWKKDDTEECTDTDQCNIGRACIENSESKKKFCTAQLPVGSACTDDYQCVNTAGCSNKICKAYFSVDDNSTAELTNLEYQNISYCKSGFLVDGTCRSLKLKTDLLDKACTKDADCLYEYTDAEKKTVEISLEDSCQCGFNKTGEKFCKKGN